MAPPRICLSMIVKNESPVIHRCLASVRPWIDHWVIVDTGSSDGTQDQVRAALAGVPGSLHERPWQDFAHNRNEALDLARAQADYVLFIDADEQLVMPLCAERIAGHTFERDVGLMEAASGSGPVPGTLMSYIAAVHSLAWATAYNLELIDAGNDMAGVNRFWAGHYLRSQWSTALVLETELAGDV